MAMIVPVRVISLNAGRPMLVGWGGGPTFSTAINKRPIDGPATIGPLGIEGDHQAHTNVHGGPELALCAYPHEHYPEVGTFLGRELPIPSFGENLTTRGLLEGQVCIGDTFGLGSATIQISQPRQPCSTLARKHGRPDLVEWIIATACTGFYFRVLQAGAARQGDTLELLDRPDATLTVERAMRAMFEPSPNPDHLRAFAELSGLSPNWRRRMGKRLDALALER